MYLSNPATLLHLLVLTVFSEFLLYKRSSVNRDSFISSFPVWRTFMSFPYPTVLRNDALSLSSVQLLSHVRLFATPWTAACQASLSIINSQSLLKLMFIELVMLSNHLILCRPLFLPPSIFPSISIFSNESVLHIRWQKYRSFSFSISPSNEYSGLISFRVD